MVTNFPCCYKLKEHEFCIDCDGMSQCLKSFYLAYIFKLQTNNTVVVTQPSLPTIVAVRYRRAPDHLALSIVMTILCLFFCPGPCLVFNIPALIFASQVRNTVVIQHTCVPEHNSSFATIYSHLAMHMYV